MLTVTRITNLKPEPTADRRYADSLGLYLKIAHNGKKTFVFRFTYVRTRHELTLGSFPEMSLAKAREARLENSRILEGGKNPLQVKAAARKAKHAALDVNELIEQFRTGYLNQHFQKPDVAYRTLKRDIGSQMGKLLVPDVTKKEIVDAINRIVMRGAKVAANRTLTLTRRMFEYAVDQVMIEQNPVVLKRSGAGGKEKARSVNLTFDEIAHVLAVLGREDIGNISEEIRNALRFLIATGKRPGEVCSMEWRHVDREKAIWVNPKELTKEQHGDHTVFLSRYALDILAVAKLRPGASKFVFPSPRDPQQQLDRHSLSRAILRLGEQKLLKVKFTPHDFRRTYSSRMSDLGQSPHIVEKTLDHLMPGVMGVYNRGQYLAERKVAMEIWGSKLKEISNS